MTVDDTLTACGTGPVDWTDGLPRSLRYDDVYHSASGALAQARHVFLGGCDLPRAWAGRAHWCVLETGFGLGLSFLATWQAWRDDPARPQQLTWLSVEAHPVGAADIRRAGARDDALRPLADRLAQAWDGIGAAPRIDLVPDDGLRLRIAVGDAAEQLEALAATGFAASADAVFLDGFSPARNPAMWSPRTLAAVAALARPDARLATWTVARSVRDGLSAVGFQVGRRPGLPPKRDCLAAIRTAASMEHAHDNSGRAPAEGLG